MTLPFQVRERPPSLEGATGDRGKQGGLLWSSYDLLSTLCQVKCWDLSCFSDREVIRSQKGHKQEGGGEG